jgi:hypothetical protein
MNVVCSAVSVALPTVGSEGMSGPLAGHIEGCSTCSREVAAYEGLYAGLAGLQDVYEPAPAELANRVMANLGPVAVPDLDDRRDRRVPVAAAAALATAAAGTAFFVRFYRHRAA